MIPKNIQDYVKIYDNWIDLEICNTAIKNLEQSKWQEHEFYISGTEETIKYDHELSVSWDDIPEREFINKRVWHGLKKYILEDFSDFAEWFSGWQGYSFVRFNRYDETTEMKKHCDHIHTLFDGERKGIPILTILGCLNNDYEGGELIMWNDVEIKLNAGSIVIFPSNFMYPHEVLPVKSGTRYSYVSWAW